MVTLGQKCRDASRELARNSLKIEANATSETLEATKDSDSELEY